MVENADKVLCPMCHGDGHMNYSEVVRKLSDPELGRKIQVYLDEITHELPHSGQLLETAAATRDSRELRPWPGNHPLRRSPKE
jgi:hypothetical protein